MLEHDDSDNSLSAVDRWVYARQANLSAMTDEMLDADFKHSARFYRALLGRRLPADKNACILDIPCGEGRMAYALRAMGYDNVTGYDLDTKRLDTGRRLGLSLEEGDCLKVLSGLPDGSVDCIFSLDFLEHLVKADVLRFLAEVSRCIAPDGMVCIRTPCADSPFGLRDIHNDFTHKWAATSGVLAQLLEAGGLTDVEVFGQEPNMRMRWGVPRVLC
ncbi:MAG: methyltransferase domain-containing protein, partial [Planctomycetes bacterium]|nr:methyltransferase domain-containing protein [Planctomycetota bacterium]